MLRFNWAVEALEQVEVQTAPTGPGPRLMQTINGDMLRVIARTVGGRLIEVWLREQPDGEYDILTAFEAGAIGKARWLNAFGEDG